MKHSPAWFIISTTLTLIVAALVPLGAQSMATSWRSVADGIDFQEFELPGPNHAYVARMQIADPNVTIDSAIAEGKLSEGRETVRDMAAREDGALNFWDGAWGATNHVVVAINGSYFGADGVPIGGIIQSGWYARRFIDMGGGSGFAWKMDRTPMIGQCVNTQADRQMVRNAANGYTVRISDINVPRGPNQTILYTPQWDTTSRTGDDGTELLIEMTAPAMVFPAPHAVLGYVREVREGKGATPIPFNSVVISAQGSAGEALARNFKVGDTVGISQEITHYESDCSTPLDLDWTKTYASVGGAVIFLKDGQIPDGIDPSPPRIAPRTAVAYNQDYIFFIVVDGRNQQYSVGMSFTELGQFARDALGATWGIAEDGGGSSTMVINGQVVNHPASACYYTYLPIVTSDQSPPPEGYPAPPPARSKSGAASRGGVDQLACERKVSNALMMVEVQPEQFSKRFKPGDIVSTRGPASLRLGPGSNYAPLAELPPGSVGTIAWQFNRLDGVQAKGAYWWYTDFAGIRGWVSEEDLDQPSLFSLFGLHDINILP